MKSKANKWRPFGSGGWILIPNETLDKTPTGFHLSFIWGVPSKICNYKHCKQLFDEVFVIFGITCQGRGKCYPKAEADPVDCLQSAFSLKIRLVLISSSTSLACLGFACSNFAKKNKTLLAVYTYRDHFLIIPDNTKTESNNCFIIHCFEINDNKYTIALNQFDIALGNHALRTQRYRLVSSVWADN